MLKRGLFAFGIILIVIMAFAAGELVGHGLGDEGAKYRRFEIERGQLAEILGADPAFRNLEIEMSTMDGSAYVAGVVPNPMELDRLRSALGKSFWKPRMDEMVRCIY